MDNSGFTEIKTAGKVPLAFSSKELYVLKEMNEDGITVEVSQKGKRKTINMDLKTSSVMSGCFLDDNSLAMLQLDEESSIKRTYLVSVADDSFSELTGYKISEENTRDLFSRLLSLGAVIERPVSLQCYGQNIYVISHQIFSDMINVVVYKLDRSAKQLNYITSFHPVNNKGRVTAHFHEKEDALFIYTENKLTTVKGTGFPKTRFFDEPGEILFLNDNSKPGVFLYFLPDNKAPGESKIRKIRF